MRHHIFFALLAAWVTTASCITIEFSPQITIRDIKVRAAMNTAKEKERKVERKNESENDPKKTQIAARDEEFGAEFELEFVEADGTVEVVTSSLTFTLVSPPGEAAAKSLLAGKGVE